MEVSYSRCDSNMVYDLNIFEGSHTLTFIEGMKRPEGIFSDRVFWGENRSRNHLQQYQNTFLDEL
mgnify:CR=1 FL=1